MTNRTDEDLQAASPAESRGIAPPPRAWLLLAVACAAQFMVVLDTSVVNVALPAIRTSLGFDAVGLQWVVTSYALVFGGFLLLGGRLADLYGTRRVFSGGLVLFVVASAVGGLAFTPGALIGARAVQALGAAVIAPASLTIVTTTFPEGPGRVRALAIWTALASAAGAAGSALGGVLTEYLTWRSTLLINLPIGVIALVAALRCLSNRRTERNGAADADRKLDVPGAISVTVGLVALTYAVSGAEERGWASASTLVALAIAVVGLAVFVVDEGWWSNSPLVPLRVFRLRSISVGNVAMLLAGACLMPMWYFLSLYMQQVLGLSAVLTGLGFLPHTLIMVLLGAQVAPRLMAWLPSRVLLALGSLIAAAGYWWQGTIQVGDTYLSAVIGPAIVMSVGAGLLNTPLSDIVTSGVNHDDAGAASGLMNTTKQVGGALGLAGLLTAAAAATSSGRLDTGATDLVSGFGLAFDAMAVLMLVVAVLALALPTPTRAGAASG